ncbi:hypothetical protein PSTG_10425 [Puccinia striiformis f. sp. tritici PST-78]|uniref:Pericentrin/AKAP-450 centrosomal targeting domain-containing protein n=1 Tax=Puccinia striiformis f. sp. tritici PST-78 TaxID=1165861 RepID=A0A0L0VAR3_9BASI|nr:hypothetical protein PSTG_10425 [Puccinia striiformis f. sp. tritici PST-78]
MDSFDFLKKRIDDAEEEGIDSLPGLPPDSSAFTETYPQDHRNAPGHIYDVGLTMNSINNTPLNSRTQNSRIQNQTIQNQTIQNQNQTIQNQNQNQTTQNQTQTTQITQTHRRIARLTPHQPTNIDHPQIVIDSPLTSTPATTHPSRHQNTWNRASPNTTHIPERKGTRPEIGTIISSSETEIDHPPPDTLSDEHSSDDGRRDKQSIGDLSLSVLDDLDPGFDDTSQSLANHQPRNLPPQKRSTKPQQSSSLSSSAGSHATVQPHMSRQNSHDHDPTVNRSEPSASQLTSPGVGRRDSFRADDSLTLDQIRDSFSREIATELQGAKKPVFGRPSPTTFQREPVPDPDTRHQKSIINNPSMNIKRMKNILNTNTKMPHRSARRPFTPKHLTEVEDDTTEISLLSRNQPSNHVNHSKPAQVAAVSDSEATSHDLTTFPGTRHQNGNSSFSFADRTHNRFNGNKLNSFLHNLNGHLSEENHQMVNALAETKAQLAHLQKENQSLRKGVIPTHSDNEDAPDRSDVLLDHLQGMINVHESIAKLQSNLNLDQGESSPTFSDSAAQNLLSERQIHRLENQLQEREEEIQEMRNQLLTKAPSISSSLKQVFELKDRLANLQADLATKDDEVDQLKLQQIDLVGQHASTVAEWRAMYEKLLAESERAKADAEKSYADRISSMKTEATALIQEKERLLMSISDKYKEVRRLTGVHAQVQDQPHQPSVETLTTIKTELEHVLNGKGDQSVGRSAERRIRMLHSWLQSEISNHEQQQPNQDLEEESEQPNNNNNNHQHQSTQEIDELRAQIEELDLELSEKEFKIQALQVTLKDSEDARNSLESEYAKLETQVDILESKTVAHQSTISGLQAKLSQALKSTFSDLSSISGTPAARSKSNSELDKALEEINHLKTLLNQSKDHIVTCEIQNLKINALENQRLQLEDRVGSLRQQASALISTPSRSSCHFQSIISMRTPKTPGKMLGNMTSILAGDSGDETIVPMLNQITELQQQVEQLRHQLDLSNKNLDSKLIKLNQASSESIQVKTDLILAVKRAEKAELKLGAAEDRLDKLIAQDGTIAHLKNRLATIACPNCNDTFDANQVVRFRVLSETQELEFIEQPSIENDQTTIDSNSFKSKFIELEAVHQSSLNQIINLKRDLERKLDHIEALENEHSNLNSEIKDLKNQLLKAEDQIQSLTHKSKLDQNRFNELDNERQELCHLKEDLEDQLEAANLELTETKNQLDQVSEARDSMDAEIRALHQQTKEQSSSTSQIESLQETISELEKERNQINECLKATKSDLEKKTILVSNSEKSYHRIQATLEKQTQEYKGLEDQLETKDNQIFGLNQINSNLVRDVKGLRSDLMSVKKDALALTSNLNQIKKNHLEVHQDRDRDHDRDIEFGKVKNQLRECQNQLKIYASSKDDGFSQHEELLKKHNLESKGLLLRIRFLKLMYTRESVFRVNLSYQKTLIMRKLHHTEIRNEAIQLALSNFGLPYSIGENEDQHHDSGNFTIHTPHHHSLINKKSFKSVAIGIRAICKLKLLAKNWSKEVRVKEKLKEAYREVRGKEFIAD